MRRGKGVKVRRGWRRGEGGGGETRVVGRNGGRKGE